MNSRNILQMLKDSHYTVVMSGIDMILENGYPALRDGDISYEMEQKYGYLPEEILSSTIYATRQDLFYKFYKNEILSAMSIPPGKGFLCLKQLEDEGLIQCIVTRRLFGLPSRAGCRNVIDLHGNVTDNFCPHCGETYSMEYVMEAEGVPRCRKCGTAIRPKICLFGEMVDNRVMTRAVSEIQKADVLMVLGAGLHMSLCRQIVQYYEGKKLILIKEQEHYSDSAADVIVYSRVDEALQALVDMQMKTK